MAARAYGIATTGGQGEAISLVKRLIDITEHGTRRNAVFAGPRIKIHGVQLRQIEQDTTRIVRREVFIAVAAGPHGRAYSIMNGSLQGSMNIGRRGADNDPRR